MQRQHCFTNMLSECESNVQAEQLEKKLLAPHIHGSDESIYFEVHT